MRTFNTLSLSMKFIAILALFVFIIGCRSTQFEGYEIQNPLHSDILDYSGIPTSADDRIPLTFSDEGAWFSYGFSDTTSLNGGFTGPFLMTQENGTWSSEMLSQLTLKNLKTGALIDWKDFRREQHSFPSHLEQEYFGEGMLIKQYLFFNSDHSATIQTVIHNVGKKKLELQAYWSGTLLNSSLTFQEFAGVVQINSTKSNALGFVMTEEENNQLKLDAKSYQIQLKKIVLKPRHSADFSLAQSFVFKDHKCNELLPVQFKSDTTTTTQLLQVKIDAKLKDVQQLYTNHYLTFMRGEYFQLADKCYLTLQNNWRSPAGELKHAGVFPSYHYEWFHGFWAWDSWKHAAALAIFDPEKAKDQVRAMYDFMQDDGFIPDCVYRDTTLEKHNYRNTKAPLSAWAVWSIYKRDRDTSFLEEMYPKLVKQHKWWYKNRDHDQDGICEYGSTDGTIIAAKWESGMDNAVRFDSSTILKNHEGAYSLNQESVDLNAYLAAEKMYLGRIAETLTKSDFVGWKEGAKALNNQIELQFFDAETGWFYDTNLDGTKFIKVMGCEGWIPLWSRSANYDQAVRVKENMMLPSKFNDSIPLQTLSADHPKFNPDGGYWRGPVWLDQAYFGIQGLHNYSFRAEAFDLSYKIIHNSEGILEKGPSIRENYNPLNGDGMEAQNFSWSAAHLLMIMGNL